MSRFLRFAQTSGLGMLGAGIIAEYSIYDVDGGTRAVIFDKVFGISDKVVGEGTHFKIPYIQEPIIMDVRSKPRIIHSSTGTKDLQMVNISLRVLSRPLESKLPQIYQKLGVDFDERVLPSLGNEVLKGVVAQHNAEELLSKRAQVSREINDALVKRAATFDLILDDVSITHLTFGREFAKAIENKQVAQQEAERQVYLVIKAEQERKAAVIRAEGEAEGAELISKAIIHAGNALIEVRRIDTAKEVAQYLSKSKNVTYLPGGSQGSNLLLQVDSNAANNH